MLTSMTRNGEKKIETAVADISIRKSERCIVEDESALPDKFVNVKTTYTPDKKRIKDAIKAGEEVPGAYIEVCSNLSVK